MTNLTSLKTSAFCRLTIVLGDVQLVGDIGGSTRRISQIAGGTIAGMLNGVILPGGSDWQVIRSDGVAEIDARYAAKLEDGRLIALRCRGYRHGPPEVMAALGRGDEQPYHSYYFMASFAFEGEACAEKGADRQILVGSGERSGNHVTFEVFRIER